MELATHWEEIRKVVSHGQKSAIHCSIASVSPDGAPHVTPVGTVFLRENCTGYYFDQYTNWLARNVDHNPRVCVMAVNTGSWFWFRSLLSGRFSSPPGVRLYGTVSPARPADATELQAVRKRVGQARRLAGGRLLWSQFQTVRDITFTDFHPVSYPSMMEGLWQPSTSQSNAELRKRL